MAPEWVLDKLRQVQRTVIACAVRRQRHLAAGVAGRDVFQVAQIVRALHVVNAEKWPGQRAHLWPGPTRLVQLCEGVAVAACSLVTQVGQGRAKGALGQGGGQRLEQPRMQFGHRRHAALPPDHRRIRSDNATLRELEYRRRFRPARPPRRTAAARRRVFLNSGT